MYIKALEQEVLRLKETFSTTTRERDTILAENRRLKELLSAHGISYDFTSTPLEFQRKNSSYGPSSSGSISGSYAQPSESTRFSPPRPGGGSVPDAHQQRLSPAANSNPMQQRNMAQLPNNRVDYDQIGIDFVLTYDSQGRPIRVPAPYPSPPPQR